MNIRISPVKVYISFVLIFFTLFSLTTLTQLIASGGAVEEATGDIYIDPLATISNYFVFFAGTFLVLILWKKSSFYKLINQKIWVFFAAYLYLLLLSIILLLNVNLGILVNGIIFSIIFFLIFDNYGYKYLLEKVRQSFFFVFFLSLIFIFLFPSYGISVGTHEGAWQGVFTHKNQFGIFLTSYLMFLILSRYKGYLRNFEFFIFVVIIFIALFFSKSSTALAVSFISIIVFYLGKLKYVVDNYLTRNIFTKFLFILFIYYSILHGADLYSDLMNKQTVGYSNRDIIWGLGIIVFSENIWFGTVVDKNFSTGDYMLAQVGATIGTFHNTYIESFATYGIFGGILFIFPVIYVALKLRKDDVLIFYSILIPLLIYMFMESLFTVKAPIMLLILTIYLLIINRINCRD